ncbi:MAG: hypothetical protein M1831_006827 [Alyxoria varia]|nr:MAG: hypothetical protein M1831_006827 [Alyxoria varia]
MNQELRIVAHKVDDLKDQIKELKEELQRIKNLQSTLDIKMNGAAAASGNDKSALALDVVPATAFGHNTPNEGNTSRKRKRDAATAPDDSDPHVREAELRKKLRKKYAATGKLGNFKPNVNLGNRTSNTNHGNDESIRAAVDDFVQMMKERSEAAHSSISGVGDIDWTASAQNADAYASSLLNDHTRAVDEGGEVANVTLNPDKVDEVATQLAKRVFIVYESAAFLAVPCIHDARGWCAGNCKHSHKLLDALWALSARLREEDADGLKKLDWWNSDVARFAPCDEFVVFGKCNGDHAEDVTDNIALLHNIAQTYINRSDEETKRKYQDCIETLGLNPKIPSPPSSSKLFESLPYPLEQEVGKTIDCLEWVKRVNAAGQNAEGQTRTMAATADGANDLDQSGQQESSVAEKLRGPIEGDTLADLQRKIREEEEKVQQLHSVREALRQKSKEQKTRRIKKLEELIVVAKEAINDVKGKDQ